MTILPFRYRQVATTESSCSIMHANTSVQDQDEPLSRNDSLKQFNSIRLGGDNHARVDKHIQDDEWSQLSSYEKKCVWVEEEMDKLGMGPYQWVIFSLCGLGYLLDLMWAHSFALVGSPIQVEFGLSDAQLSNLFAAFSIGLAIGAAFWGIAVDIVGRKISFNITCLISGLAGVIIPAFDSYIGLLIFVVLVGTGIGGNIPVDTTITLEFLPTHRRALLATLSIFQPIGVVLASIWAYFLIPSHSCEPSLKSCRTDYALSAPAEKCCHKADNMGWRYLIWCAAGVSLLSFAARCAVFTLRESPKFLLSQGKDEEALAALVSIAKYNRSPKPDLTLERLRSVNSTSSSSISDGPRKFKKSFTTDAFKRIKKALADFFLSLKPLCDFSTPVAWTFVLLCVAYISDFWAFVIAGQFLPLVLLRKSVQLSVSTKSTYLHYIMIYSSGIPAALISTLLIDIPKVGRKWAMVGSATMMGVSLCLYATVNSVPSQVGLNALEYFFQTILNAILFAFTAEAFQGPIRGKASGLTSMLGRVASIIAPLVVGGVMDHSTNLVLYLAGGGAFVAALALAALPFETSGKIVY